MNFFKKLEGIRQRPEGVRRRILIAALTVLMFLIIVVWFSTLDLGRAPDEKSRNTEALKPWEVLGRAFQTGTRDIGDSLGSILPKEIYEKEE